MIGSGVFIVAADIGRQVQSPGLLLLSWAVTALLTLIALVAGTAQVSIFTSLVAGLDAFTEQTIADGSRLTRLTLKPRKADMAKDDRFPLQAELARPSVLVEISVIAVRK